jgi:acetyl-CoA acyltransferase 1
MEKATERQRILLRHLQPSSSSDASLSASACLSKDSAAYQYGDDVVIVAAQRTALCKAKRGSFKDTFPDELLASVLRALIEKTNVNPSEVGDIVVGTVLGPGSQRASECRMAAFYAGFPGNIFFCIMVILNLFFFFVCCMLMLFLSVGRNCSHQNREQTVFIWASGCC